MTQEENSVIKECYRILHEVDKTSEELAKKRQCYTCALGRCDETGCYCENAADDFACEDSGCSNYQDGTLSYAKIAEDDLAYLLDHLPCLLNCISEQTARAEAAEKKLKEAVSDFYQYAQGGTEICAYCLHDNECEPGETMCGATFKAFRWRGMREGEE
jgi:hypothetical protein